MQHVLRAIFAAFLLIVPWAGAVADNKTAPASVGTLEYLPALAGGYFAINSQETRRIYHIYIRLPQNYAADPARRYPIVYVLDGDSLFPILAATHLFLTIDDKMPEVIVVGICYGGFDTVTNKRSIDFMPPSANLATEKSGAPAFQKFLENELLPTVEAQFRTDTKRRILFGQSRSGAFVVYSAFTDPDLFWGRIASSPALPPTQDFFYGTPAAAKRKDLRLFVAEGPGDSPALRAATVPWMEALQARAGKPWTLVPITIPNGTHSANSPDAYRIAMRQLFDVHPDIEQQK